MKSSDESRQYTAGIKDTVEAFELGQISKLILWEELKYKRIEVVKRQKNDAELESEVEVLYLPEIPYSFTQDYRILSEQPLIDWFLESSCDIMIISNNTSEGNQFVRSFEGVGSILSYPVKNYESDAEENEFEDQFNDEDFI